MNVENIWHEYQGSLKRFLQKNISDPDDVDDLLQEVLIKSYNNLPKLRDSKKLKSWLFQIASNTIRDFYRRKKPNLDLESENLWYEEAELQASQQLSDCIVPFISALPKADADLLTAIEINGVSQKEYAETSGINYSTLKSRVQKSRQALYALFDQCCTFSIDSRGNVYQFQSKNQGCERC